MKKIESVFTSSKAFLGIIFVALIGIFVSTIAKPNILLYDGGDQDITVKMVDNRIDSKGVFHALYSLGFKLSNKAITPGFLNHANCYPTTLSKHNLKVNILEVDKTKIYPFSKVSRKIELSVELALQNINTKKPSVIYCTLIDNESQMISEKLNFAIITGRKEDDNIKKYIK